MTVLDWLAENWPMFATTAGGVGGGGLLTKWWGHRRAERKQTDEVALSLVQTLNNRVTLLEAASKTEREQCAASLRLMTEQILLLGSDLDAVLLAIELAPDKAPEIAAKVRARRGDFRNAVQSFESARTLSTNPKGSTS